MGSDYWKGSTKDLTGGWVGKDMNAANSVPFTQSLQYGGSLSPVPWYQAQQAQGQGIGNQAQLANQAYGALGTQLGSAQPQTQAMAGLLGQGTQAAGSIGDYSGLAGSAYGGMYGQASLANQAAGMQLGGLGQGQAAALGAGAYGNQAGYLGQGQAGLAGAGLGAGLQGLQGYSALAGQTPGQAYSDFAQANPALIGQAGAAADAATQLYGQSAEALAAQRSNDARRALEQRFATGGVFGADYGAARKALGEAVSAPYAQAMADIAAQRSSAFNQAYNPQAQALLGNTLAAPERQLAGIQAGQGVYGQGLAGLGQAAQTQLGAGNLGLGQAGALGNIASGYGSAGNLYNQTAGTLGNIGAGYAGLGGLAGNQAGIYGSLAQGYGNIANLNQGQAAQNAGILAQMGQGYTGVGNLYGTQVGLSNQAAAQLLAALAGQSQQAYVAPNNQYNQPGWQSTLGGLAGGAGTAAGAAMFSDERVKKDITDAEGLLEDTAKLRSVRYRYEWEDTPRLGILAQDLAESKSFADVVDSSNPILALDPAQLSAHNTAVIAEMARELLKLKARIATLEGN